jgi:outer membrane lipoprotein-sorting protein
MSRLLALALIAAPATVAAAPANPLDQVSAHLKAVETMTAHFVQTSAAGKSVGGTLTLKRPGRIRFQYDKGVPLLIVGDGSGLMMIDYQVKQVSRWPIGKSPLGVLLNANPDLSRLGKVIADPPDGPMLIESRDPKHPEFGVITIAFQRSPDGPAGLRLEGWSVLDAQNNRSTVRLSDQRFNVPVSGDSFRWIDPRPNRPAGKL